MLPLRLLLLLLSYLKWRGLFDEITINKSTRRREGTKYHCQAVDPILSRRISIQNHAIKIVYQISCIFKH